MTNPLKKFLKPKIEMLKGTRFVSFLFIGLSILIAAGIMLGASIYYNIDTGEVVMEEIQRVTGVLRATAGAIVGGTASQNPSTGYAFEVVGSAKLATTTIATGTLELTAANQELRFTGGIANYYVGFKANTSATSGQAIMYTLPAAPPDANNYVLTSNPSGVWQWSSVAGVGAGDVTAVGDCAGGSCFTGDDTNGGNQLWFEGATADANEILLTAADPGSDYTITLPAANGYVALGSSTANYVAYWSSNNVLTGEQYLSTSRGGIGTSSSAWTGVAVINSGAWSASSTLSVGVGGTGRTSWTQWGVLYADTSGSLTNTSAGTADYLLVGAGAGAPTWKYLGQLLTAGSNISLTGTTNVTIATVQDPTFAISVTTPQLLSTTSLAIQSGNSQDITIDSSSGRILLSSGDWIETSGGYQIGKSGTQVLREMIPIMGFDLPVRTATSGTVKISRDIQKYPSSACSAGTSRVHKLVIRYGSMGTTTWAVATSTGAYTSFDLPPTNSTSTGAVYTATTTIPTPSGACTGWSQTSDTDDWWVRVSPSSNDTMIYQVFLAIYDQIQ